MNILFITDEYPPFETGGFAQLCCEVAEGLRHKGHDVRVLCEKLSVQGNYQEEKVFRQLEAPVSWSRHIPVPLQQLLAGQKSAQNFLCFQKMIAANPPDCIVVWPTVNLDIRLIAALESSSLPVAYYNAGFSPTEPSLLDIYWGSPGKTFRAKAVKALLRPFFYYPRTDKLVVEHMMCVSEFECRRAVRNGVPAGNTNVIYNGIQLSEFPFSGLPSLRRADHDTVRILCTGRLAQYKGVHTVLEALHIVKNTSPSQKFQLTILGKGDARYTDYLQQIIHDYRMEDAVVIESWVPRDQVPNILAKHDIFILPTIHDEPLARSVQEAMAVGLVVLATPTGGTPEAIVDRQTGLFFPAGDSQALANCIVEMANDPKLADILAVNAREKVEDKFSINSTISRIEKFLSELCELENE